jgi:hypothetical protein
MRITRAQELIEAEKDLDLECIKGKITDQFPPKVWRDEIQEDFGILIDGQQFKLRFNNTQEFGTKFEGQDWRGRFVLVEATPSDRDGKLCGLKFKISKGFKYIACSYKANMVDVGAAPAERAEPAGRTVGQVAKGIKGEPREELPKDPKRYHDKAGPAGHPAENFREPEQYREEPPAEPPAARPSDANALTESKKVANRIANVYRVAMHKVLAPGGLLEEMSLRYGATVPPSEVSSIIAHLSIEFHKKNMHTMMPDSENVLDIFLGPVKR